MANDKENETGYKKPPKAFRFQKGLSGNPSGRPRRAQGIPEMLSKVAKQRVLTKGKDGPRWMTKFEAGCTQLVNQMAGGDLKAIYLYAKLMSLFAQTVNPTDTEDKVASAKAKLLKLLEARYGAFAKGSAEGDQR